LREIAASASRAAMPALSPENRRLPSPNEVGCTAKFDHSAIGLPSARSTRSTVTVGSTDAARCPAGSFGMSRLRLNASKLRLRDAPSARATPKPTRAGFSRESAATIASAIPCAVDSKTRGSNASPPTNA
jgi:hypothetical protein